MCRERRLTLFLEAPTIETREDALDEHADDPRYPAPMTATAYRFGVNYVVYAMTHRGARTRWRLASAAVLAGVFERVQDSSLT